MKYLLHAYFSLGLLTAQWGCDSSIEDLKNESLQSSVPTTEANGVVTASVNPAVSATVVGSSTSNIADSSIMIPSGALVIDGASTSVNIAMGEAKDQSNDIALATGFSASTIVNGTGPLFVGGAANPLAVSQEVLISMPLPIKQEDLALHSGGHLVMLYVIYTGNGYKAGIKPLEATDLRGIFVETKIAGLGFFRVVYLGVHVDAKEVTVNFTPGLKS